MNLSYRFPLLFCLAVLLLSGIRADAARRNRVEENFDTIEAVAAGSEMTGETAGVPDESTALPSDGAADSLSYDELLNDQMEDLGDLETLTILMDSLGYIPAFEEDTTVYDFDLLLDNLMNVWYLQDSTQTAIESFDASFVAREFPDSVYIDRLRRIPSLVSLTYNNVIRNYIHVYTIQKAAKLSVILGLKDYYFPMIEEILDQYGLPLELKYMTVIESALNPDAVSRAGATGLWQFMLSTGRFYKLQITSFVDERRDPVAATHAAARYLSDMYEIYHDWGLVIAAYNCGAGNVNKAIRRAGGKRTYWEIYPYLPKETRGYVPAYIAATYAMTYYEAHHITPTHVDMPVASDTIMIRRNLNLHQVSEVLQIPYEELRTLNSVYRRDVIPGDEKPYPLKLPTQYVGTFIDLQDSIFNYMADVYLKESLFKATAPSSSASTATVAVNAAGRQVYTVRRGDTLSAIARRFGITVDRLRQWNGISGSRINVGQRLVVSAAASSSSSASSSTSSGGGKTYTVKQGDTLSRIAQQFHVTVTQLRSWNNLSGSVIKVGQKLVVGR
ncbi:MAG: LysM peptidoglycan-binding domain-containing protein [Bacteroidales bacterium]|nr:LysM peptidoglycan-binding domain-containing protein [Bacteroidales bacterium]